MILNRRTGRTLYFKVKIKIISKLLDRSRLFCRYCTKFFPYHVPTKIKSIPLQGYRSLWVIEITSPRSKGKLSFKIVSSPRIHATFSFHWNSRIATDIASNDNDITEIQPRHRGRGQIGRARHSVSLRKR